MQNNRTHTTMRKARTQTLIQLGGLFVKAGLMEKFNIQAGDNLQHDPEKKENAYAILGALLELKSMMDEGDFHKGLWEKKGARAFNKEEEK